MEDRMNDKINTFCVGLFVSGMILMFGLWLAEDNFFLKQMFAVVYIFLPMIAVVLINKKNEDKKVITGFSLTFNRIFLLAIAIPFALAFSSALAGIALPGISYSADFKGYFQRYESPGSGALLKQMLLLPLPPVVILSFIALGAGLSYHALLALGEETGWRGFLYRELRFRGFWRYSLWAGLAWGIWEVPLVFFGRFYPTRPLFGSLLVVVWCVAASPLFTWIRDRSGSIVATAMLLGLINACQPLSVMILSSSDELLTGIRGLSGVFILGIINLVIFLSKQTQQGEKG
jgi:uncharacterized protein